MWEVGTGWVEPHRRTLGSKQVTVFTLANSSWLGPGRWQIPEWDPRCPGGQAAQREWTWSGPPCHRLGRVHAVPSPGGCGVSPSGVQHSTCAFIRGSRAGWGRGHQWAEALTAPEP